MDEDFISLDVQAHDLEVGALLNLQESTLKLGSHTLPVVQIMDADTPATKCLKFQLGEANVSESDCLFTYGSSGSPVLLFGQRT